MWVLWVKRTGVIWSQLSQHLEILACFFGDDDFLHCGNLCWRKTLWRLGISMEEQLLKHPTCLITSAADPKISVLEDKSWIFFWGSQIRQVQVQGGWAHSLVGEGTNFGEFFGINQKIVPKNLLGCYLGAYQILGGGWNQKIWNAFFF